jgi:hypothetical protein
MAHANGGPVYEGPFVAGTFTGVPGGASHVERVVFNIAGLVSWSGRCR